MESWWNVTDRGTEVLGEKTVTVPLYPPQFLHGLAWDGIPGSAVRGWRLGFGTAYRRKLTSIVHLNSQSVPRSKQTASGLYKPVS